MKQAVEMPATPQRSSKQPIKPQQLQRKGEDLSALSVNDALAALKKKFEK